MENAKDGLYYASFASSASGGSWGLQAGKKNTRGLLDGFHAFGQHCPISLPTRASNASDKEGGDALAHVDLAAIMEEEYKIAFVLDEARIGDNAIMERS